MQRYTFHISREVDKIQLPSSRLAYMRLTSKTMAGREFQTFSTVCEGACTNRTFTVRFILLTCPSVLEGKRRIKIVICHINYKLQIKSTCKHRSSKLGHICDAAYADHTNQSGNMPLSCRSHTGYNKNE